MTDAPTTPRWRILLTPRWLGWHLFAVAAVAGMIWLGDWQFRRAMAGNTLSWAYTFEWPAGAPAGPGQVTAADGADGAGAEHGQADTELAEYNAYLARLSTEVKGHGRWHGLR